MFELFPLDGTKLYVYIYVYIHMRLVDMFEADCQNTSWNFPRHRRFLVLPLRWFERSTPKCIKRISALPNLRQFAGLRNIGNVFVGMHLIIEHCFADISSILIE